MKRILLILVIVLTTCCCHAQTFNPTYSISSSGTADSFKGGYTFAYATSGTPWNGALISFGGVVNNYDCQISAIYGAGGNHISFRTHNGDYGTWNPWFEIYHSGNLNNSSSDFTARNVTTNGIHIASGVYSTAQGTYLGWNMSHSIGEVNFVNNIGWGTGGYTFDDTADGVTFTRLMTIQGNGNVGIGTNNPLTPLDVKLGANQHIQFAANVNSAYSGASGIVCINDANTAYTPLGFYASNYYFGGGQVGINTMDTKGYQFAVNGSAIATSMMVKLNANWPDYVFKPEYHLPSLTEVKAYIDQNQHLPDMPSAQEVEKNGQNLGEMNKLLTKKVEELTLYLVEKDKQITEIDQRQQAELKIQNEINKKLQEQLNELQKQLKTNKTKN